jgi:hypothetical protein
MVGECSGKATTLDYGNASRNSMLRGTFALPVRETDDDCAGNTRIVQFHDYGRTDAN